MKHYIVIFIIVLSTFFTGCTDDFEKINTDPHQFSQLEPEQLFTTAVKNTGTLLSQLNASMYFPYSQQVSITSGDAPRFGSSYSDINSSWSRFYEIIYYLKTIQDTYSEDPNYANRVQIAKIWESYLFYVFATTFGPLPYTDACSSTKKVLDYDKEEFIYENILNTLKTAYQTLDPEKDKLSSDVIFPESKDINRWKKLANSLRLKIAMETQLAIPEVAAEHIRDIMQDESGLVSSNSENIAIKFNGTATVENSWYYEKYINDKTTSEGSRPYFSHLMFVYMRAYPDSRMEKYAEKTKSPFMVKDTLYYDNTYSKRAIVSYEVPYSGRPESTQLGGLDDNENSSIENNPFRSTSDDQYSLVNLNFLKADGSINIIWYADICFLKAEAKQRGLGGAKSVEEYYYEGIDASYNQYGLSAAQATNYKKVSGVKWNTDEPGYPEFRGLVYSELSSDPIQKIIVQRWLAGFFHGAHDAYCYLRRTRAFEITPNLNPGKVAYGSQPKIANLPERMQYPLDERTYNQKGYEQGVSILGGIGDYLSVYLKIAKEYNRKTEAEWMMTPVYLNNACYIKWYGGTIEELKAQAVNYTILEELIDQESGTNP